MIESITLRQEGSGPNRKVFLVGGWPEVAIIVPEVFAGDVSGKYATFTEDGHLILTLENGTGKYKLGDEDDLGRIKVTLVK